MRNLILFLCAAPLFAAGSIQQTLTQQGYTDTYLLTITAVADAADGSFPSRAIIKSSGNGLNNIDGFSIVNVETVPGTPAPTDNWDFALTDASSLDLLGAACINRDTATPETCASNPVPINGTVTIAITGNSVNSAQIVIKVYLVRSTVAKRGGTGAGSITTITGSGGIVITDPTGPTTNVDGSGIALTLGNAVTRVNGTTVTVSASDASGFATGTGPASFTTLATFTIDTRTITAIADIGGSPKQTRITFGTAWPTTTLAIAENLSICGATGTGTSGMNNIFTVQDRSDTTHADIILDSTGMTYTASSATAGCNAAATGTVWFSGDDAGTVQAQVPSSTGLILTSTGGPTTINQTQSPTYNGSPFGTVDIVAGAFSGTATNARTAQRAWPVYAGNSGITVNPSSSGTTISTTADVMSKSGTNAVTGIIDLTLGAAFSPPGSNTLPATCGVGQLYIKRNATATVQLYVCTSTDTWTAQGGASGVITGTQFVGTQGTLAGSSTPVFTSTATWNNAATAFTHIFANVTNTASAAGSLLMDLQIGGASQINVTKAGVLTTAGYIQSGSSFIAIAGGTYTYLSRGGYYAPADGVFGMFNNNQNDFGRLCIGLCTSSFPALKRSTTVIQARLADDSNFATFQGNFTSTDGSSGVTGATCSSFKNGLCVAP